MKHHPIPRLTAKFLLAPILLFALYVQFHGDFGPGGGFQAGVIFAAAIILYALTHSTTSTKKLVPEGLLRVLAALGILLYTGTGIASLVLGSKFLDYNVLGSSPQAGQHLGILLVEAGVGMTVAAVMILLYYSFAGRSES